MNAARHLLACALLAAAGPAQAADAAQAHRYRTADGVEVLTNRAAAAAAPASSPNREAPAPEPKAAAASVPAPAALAPVSHRVPAPTQAQRDSERMAILAAELLTESRTLERKRQALRAALGRGASDDDTLQALRDDVTRREENVRAIDREMRRAGFAAREP